MDNLRIGGFKENAVPGRDGYLEFGERTLEHLNTPQGFYKMLIIAMGARIFLYFR